MEYVFAVVRKDGEIVQKVYKVDNWYEEQDGDQQKIDIDLCFNGRIAKENIRSKYKGKYIPEKCWWRKGVVASCFYTYDMAIGFPLEYWRTKSCQIQF